MKTYTINGKEIKMDEVSPRDVLEQLLDALDEKKEEPKSGTHNFVDIGEVKRIIKNI